jgi:DMSO/TMAO reductase YedYZ molybdopterin-dependent catalytic subunit
VTDDPQPNDKLVRTKQAWARARRLITGITADPNAVRLPPGQTLVKDWPVLDLGQQPDIPHHAFRLDLGGAVRRPASLDYAAFMALPQTDSVSDMHCVTQWSRYDNEWQGVSAQVLLDLVQPKDEVRHVLFQAHDGYTTNVTLAQFAEPDVFLVHRWNGQPIDRRHGGPVRVLIPRLYLWKSPKWIHRIEFSITDRPGFWEVRGYHNNADPWAEERYSA